MTEISEEAIEAGARALFERLRYDHETWEACESPGGQQAWRNDARTVLEAALPLIETLTAPRSRFGDAWTELTGYIREAADDGEPLDPAVLLDYMSELRTRALTPIREWMGR